MIEERVKYLGAFVSYVFKQYFQDRCSSIAAELTVTSLLALVPLTSVIFALLAFIPSFQAYGEQVQTWLFTYFVPGTGETVQNYINEFVGKARELSGIGSAMLLITALLLMRTIDSSLNKIWHAESNKSFIRTFLVYWAVLTLGPILLGSSVLISSYIKSLPLISDVVNNSQWLSIWLPFLLEAIAFSVIFYVIPNRKISLWHAGGAALITAVLFEVAKYLFGVFVTSFSTYQVIFGALAAVPLFLIWIYLCWGILLFGAELCHAMETFELENEETHLHPFIEVVSLLVILAEAQKNGVAVTESELKRASQNGKIGYSIEWLEKLVAIGLVTKTQEQSYCLLKTANELDYSAVYEAAGNEFPSLSEIESSDLPDAVKSNLTAFIESIQATLSGRLAVECHQETNHP